MKDATQKPLIYIVHAPLGSVYVLKLVYEHKTAEDLWDSVKDVYRTDKRRRRDECLHLPCLYLALLDYMYNSFLVKDTLLLGQ